MRGPWERDVPLYTLLREYNLPPKEGYGEDVSLLGVAGSGEDDAVRLAGCEGSVSLSGVERTGEG